MAGARIDQPPRLTPGNRGIGYTRSTRLGEIRLPLAGSRNAGEPLLRASLCRSRRGRRRATGPGPVGQF